MRKMHIAQLKADIACNEILEPRLRQITNDVEAKGPSEFSSLVERFKTNPSPEAPPTNAPAQKTYDEMLLSLMLMVWEEAKQESVEKDDPRLGDALVKGIKKHITELGQHQEKLRKELAEEEAEQKKKITSDDIHEGWESHVSPLVRVFGDRYLTEILSTNHRNPLLHRSRIPSPVPQARSPKQLSSKSLTPRVYLQRPTPSPHHPRQARRRSSPTCQS